jgi:signal transduction histidine kinase
MEFRISSELKNIIGKDLIINDEVAIFELVKNAYDAHATRVDITFEKDKIIIQDNGKGMDLKDIQDKWLFVAYSAKKDDTEDSDLEDDKYKDYRDKINLKRGFAGAKGIGRFSCDRLGSKLKLISKKVSSNTFHQLDVNWDDFEQDAKNDFINIQVNYITPPSLKYDDFQNGVILEITNLRSEWNEQKIKKLTRSLGKLINPFEINTYANNFHIFINDNKSLFNQPIKNELLDVLSMKTTKIEVTIGIETITTHLVDRGMSIYKIEEKNMYKHLKNTSIILLYLNQKARNNFTRIMGITTKEFPNVMLYNNGFRVYPFGEPGDDSLGIDKRYQQGIRRYLSTRNLIGSININEYSEQFKEKTSRDSGLIESGGYLEAYNFFWNSLKRLEKYVVGIQWGLDDLAREKDNDSEDLVALNTLESKSKIIELIKKLTSSKDIKILDFDSGFLNIINEYNIDEPIVKTLLDIAQKSNKPEILNELNILQKKINDLSNQKNSLEKDLYITEEKNIQLSNENQKVKEELYVEKEKTEASSKALEEQTKRNIFQGSVIGMEKEQILGLQHQIYHSSSRINRNIELFVKSIDPNILSEKQKKYLSVITHEAEKISSISNFVTKANFNLTASDITTDLISFMKEYIDELYLSRDRIIDSKVNIINIKNISDTFIKKIRPLEITTLIDNFIQNAEKANSKQIIFTCKVEDSDLLLLIEDDGKGIEEERIKHIFELGHTTTDGSGIGLFNVQTTVKKMNGSIKVDSTPNKGTTFTIRFKHAN